MSRTSSAPELNPWKEQRVKPNLETLPMFRVHLLSEFLKYQVLGFPLGLRPSNNSHPIKTKSSQSIRHNDYDHHENDMNLPYASKSIENITNLIQYQADHLLCASVGRIGCSCAGNPPTPSPTPTTLLLLTAAPG